MASDKDGGPALRGVIIATAAGVSLVWMYTVYPFWAFTGLVVIVMLLVFWAEAMGEWVDAAHHILTGRTDGE